MAYVYYVIDNTYGTISHSEIHLGLRDYDFSRSSRFIATIYAHINSLKIFVLDFQVCSG